MEQIGPKRDIRELSYGILIPCGAKCHSNTDWAMHRNSPPFHYFKEYPVTMGYNPAHHPYFSPDCSALMQAGPCYMSQPGIAEYSQPQQECTYPVLFTSPAPYPPPYMYQPMAVQLPAHATQTPFYMYSPGTMMGPIVCNISLCLVDLPNEV